MRTYSIWTAPIRQPFLSRHLHVVSSVKRSVNFDKKLRLVSLGLSDRETDDQQFRGL